jgi:hypothetical protein
MTIEQQILQDIVALCTRILPGPIFAATIRVQGVRTRYTSLLVIHAHWTSADNGWIWLFRVAL